MAGCLGLQLPTLCSSFAIHCQSHAPCANVLLFGDSHGSSSGLCAAGDLVKSATSHPCTNRIAAPQRCLLGILRTKMGPRHHSEDRPVCAGTSLLFAQKMIHQQGVFAHPPLSSIPPSTRDRIKLVHATMEVPLCSITDTESVSLSAARGGVVDSYFGFSLRSAGGSKVGFADALCRPAGSTRLRRNYSFLLSTRQPLCSGHVVSARSGVLGCDEVLSPGKRGVCQGFLMPGAVDRLAVGRNRTGFLSRRLADIDDGDVNRRDFAACTSYRTSVIARMATSVTERVVFPDFLPPEVEDIEEEMARDMAMRIEKLPVQGSFCDIAIPSSFVGPLSSSNDQTTSSPMPIVLLHGFDSSCLEFRRLHMRLCRGGAEAWAVDILGWGFSDTVNKGVKQFGPAEKTEHLFEFWRQHIRKPMLVVGASLGGTLALELALTHPEAVAQIALIDAQGFAEGTGNLAKLPDFLAYAGVAVLKSQLLRELANRMTYHDVKTYATADAVRVGRLSCLMPGWAQAQVSFIKSGGFNVARRIPEVRQKTLIIWGEEDKIIPPSTAQVFVDLLPCSSLTWIPECGHVPHLEKPAMVAERLLAFVNE
ncbi:hypothetical protein CBR_g10860 [Chara braunii]|uniref:AB hydrolase-1 domain-containing protein n=1 Tax=Chara braunii TaxID=69332 RepID=A0A388KPE5_CHABU|nr:hypothetical protein CBR_g10860 [Chara braunii]|eukprot:GBG71924.1 hypothetical protein CBR_g10860 [Chara braunii]